MVIGLILFVIIVVAAIYFSMMSTINKIKDEQEEVDTSSVLIERSYTSLPYQLLI